MISTRLVARALALVVVAASVAATSASGRVAAVPSPDLVISQIYGGGDNSLAPFNADFVELFNRGTAARSAGGLSVQYTSATGTGAFGASAAQLVVLPDVSVPPGGSLLVGMTTGTVGADLPTPDATGSIAMSAAAGKVALVTGTDSLGCNGANLPCSVEQLGRVVDLAGYGNANFAEGQPAPGLSNTTAARRIEGGCTDTDANDTDFVAAAPEPRNSASPLQPCSSEPANTPPAVTPNPLAIEHRAGTAATYTLQASDDVIVADVAVDGSLPAGIALDPGTAGPTRTITISVASAVGLGAYPFAVIVSDDVGATTAVPITVSVVPDPCAGSPSHTIMEVQGAGTESPLTGETVQVDGVVTESYQARGEVGGFYLQDPDGDRNDATSDGLLVFDNADQVEPGDVVRVAGRVAEFERSANEGAGTVTELVAPFDVAVCGTGSVAPTTVQLPFPPTAGGAGGVPAPERYEGMRVTMPNARTVTEVFTLGRFGEVVLTSGPPLFAPTNGNVPGTPEEIEAANDRNRILLDDGLGGSNLYPGAYVVGDDPNAVPRVGDVVASEDRVDGILTFDFGVYRVQPVGEYVDFATGIPRPPAPDPVGGDVRIASFNVLNYFTTINDSRWAGATDTPRGATSAAELARQQDKIVRGIIGLDADVVGLLEIENNGPSSDARVGPDAVGALVAAINAALPAGSPTYAAIAAPVLNAPNFLGGTFGTDAIKVAVIYRPARLAPLGPAVSDPLLVDPPDPAFPSMRLFSRPPIAQTFRLASGAGVPFTVIVNHFKSKGSLQPNCDPAGGGLQGNCNDLRVRQAQGVLHLVAGARLQNVAIIGDLNAYSREDPIATLEAAGYTSPVDSYLPAADRYSYVFDGERGELDHAVVDGDMRRLVTGADIWHINSIEPPAKDYTRFNHPNLFEPNAYRSSDHDPVLVGLDLTPAASCHGLAATIAGSARGDLLVGTARRDVIAALGGNDLVAALGGDDVVCAGDGTDVVFAGDGDDTVLGEAGVDVLLGEQGDDVLAGGPGRDLLAGGPGDDTLFDGDLP